MRRLLIGVMASGLLLSTAVSGLAQGNPRDTAKLTLGNTTITVEYGRPSLKGRTVTEMLGRLKPGGFWRLGADTSTTFSTTGDLQFSHATVPKGEYSLWAQRGANNTWKLVFNKQHGQWGTQHDASQDLVSVPLKEIKASESAEEVTIGLKEGGGAGVITIHWGDLQLAASFKTK